jgi:hypothetical protein
MANAKDTGFRSRWDIIENERLLLLAIRNINNASQGLGGVLGHHIDCAQHIAERIISERPNKSLTEGQ